MPIHSDFLLEISGINKDFYNEAIQTIWPLILKSDSNYLIKSWNMSVDMKEIHLIILRQGIEWLWKLNKNLEISDEFKVESSYFYYSLFGHATWTDLSDKNQHIKN